MSKMSDESILFEEWWNAHYEVETDGELEEEINEYGKKVARDAWLASLGVNRASYR